MLNNRRVINNIVIGANVEILELKNQVKFKNLVSDVICETKVKNEYSGIGLTLQQKNGRAKNLNIYEMFFKKLHDNIHRS